MIVRRKEPPTYRAIQWDGTPKMFDEISNDSPAYDLEYRFDDQEEKIGRPALEVYVSDHLLFYLNPGDWLFFRKDNQCPEACRLSEFEKLFEVVNE